MTYQEAVDFLYSSTPVFQREGATAYKPGLETIQSLSAHYLHPHTAYRTIHVAGTNGKGSTSHSLAAILAASGYRVGLFTSPHLLDFRERIRVDGVPVGEEFVTSFVEEVRPLIGQYTPSFFELTTLMAFVYFRLAKVDIAVIEVGMGGRLDSTNILRPLLSIITGISLDHTQYLGETLPEIAGEKAGIIKAHTPVVLGRADEPEVLEVFQRRARELDAPLTLASEAIEVAGVQEELGGQTFALGHRAYPLPERLFFGLGGEVQRFNLSTILTSVGILRQMGLRISDEALRQGLGEVCRLTGLRGRWEILGRDPLLICDTGHNEEGIRYVTHQLRALGRPLRILFGMVSDKDVTSVLRLLPEEAIYYFTAASVPRALSPEELQQRARQEGLEGRAFSDIGRALEMALSEADARDVLFVGGSNFVVADLLAYHITHK